MKYNQNDIVKPFKVKILRYGKRVHEMHDLYKYLPPTLMKDKISEADNWTVRNQEFTASEIRVEIKDGLPSSMQDELEDHPEDYHSLNYEDYCDLLSTIKVKYERKRAATQIKKIASAISESLSDSAGSVRILRKKKARTGILRSNKGPQKKVHKHHGTQRY